MESSTTSKAVIYKLKQHFARHGIPYTVFSDNGPQFDSEEFRRFSHSWEFHHVTSSPGHAQSNGMVESAIKTAKRLIKKATKDKTDPWLAILDHRNTPSEGMQSSRAQRLMSRRTRTLLPTSVKLLKPKLAEGVEEEKAKIKAKQAFYYDRNARDLPPLRKGDTVRVKPIKNPKEPWLKATVQDQVNLRSYKVVTDDGSTLRRNRKHLKVTPQMNEQTEPSSTPQLPNPSTLESVQQETDTGGDLQKSDNKIKSPTPTTLQLIQEQPKLAAAE